MEEAGVSVQAGALSGPPWRQDGTIAVRSFRDLPNLPASLPPSRRAVSGLPQRPESHGQLRSAVEAERNGLITRYECCFKGYDDSRVSGSIGNWRGGDPGSPQNRHAPGRRTQSADVLLRRARPTRGQRHSWKCTRAASDVQNSFRRISRRVARDMRRVARGNAKSCAERSGSCAQGAEIYAEDSEWEEAGHSVPGRNAFFTLRPGRAGLASERIASTPPCRRLPASLPPSSIHERQTPPKARRRESISAPQDLRAERNLVCATRGFLTDAECAYYRAPSETIVGVSLTVDS